MKTKMLIMAVALAAVASLLLIGQAVRSDEVIKVPGPMYDQDGDRVLDEDTPVTAEMPLMET
jgi:hypothetical protein